MMNITQELSRLIEAMCGKRLRAEEEPPDRTKEEPDDWNDDSTYDGGEHDDHCDVD